MAYRDLSARRRAHRIELSGGDTGDARTLQGHPASDFMLSGGGIPVLYDATGKVIYEQATSKQIARLDYNDHVAAPAAKALASDSWLGTPVLDNTGPNLFGGTNQQGSGTGPLIIAPWNASEVQIGRSNAPSKVYSPLSGGQSQLNTVFAQYNTGSGQSIANTTNVPVNYNSKIYDTHNAVATGAGWTFTVPVAGLYLVQALASLVHALSQGVYGYLWLKKNTSEAPAGRGPRITFDAGMTSGYPVGYSLNTLVVCAVNDTLQINLYQYTGASRNLDTLAAGNYVSILRIAGA